MSEPISEPVLEPVSDVVAVPGPGPRSGHRVTMLDRCDVGQVAGTPCPVCDAPLGQEHAHTRCRHCGWLGKCCE